MTHPENSQPYEVSLSTLIMSIAQSALMALGLAPNPATGQTETNKDIAKFNIDLLMVLQTKTKNNLSEDEEKFLNSVIKDLQLNFVQFDKKS